MFASVQQVQDNLAKARQRIMAGELSLVGVVDNWPITAKFRGAAKLGVERSKHGKYRTIKMTTTKKGGWSSPKKSKYMSAVLCVIYDCVTKRYGWLRIGILGITIQWPTGVVLSLAEPPHWCKPRRTPETYNLITHEPFTDQVLRTEKIVQPADPPELCDACDAWEAGICDLIPIVKRVWEVKHEVANAR